VVSFGGDPSPNPTVTLNLERLPISNLSEFVANTEKVVSWAVTVAFKPNYHPPSAFRCVLAKGRKIEVRADGQEQQDLSHSFPGNGWWLESVQ
jgi:hypothetical protein